MTDHTRNSMQAAARSMRDVVMPAVDPQDPLAREQAGLVVKYLEFWAERVDQLAARDLAELTSYVRVGEQLVEAAAELSIALDEALTIELERARATVAASAHDVSAVEASVAGLSRVITALVRTAADVPGDSATTVERVVTEGSRDVALLQRAWFAPQGWEDPPPPALEDVLHRLIEKGASS